MALGVRGDVVQIRGPVDFPLASRVVHVEPGVIMSAVPTKYRALQVTTTRSSASRSFSKLDFILILFWPPKFCGPGPCSCANPALTPESEKHKPNASWTPKKIGTGKKEPHLPGIGGRRKAICNVRHFSSTILRGKAKVRLTAVGEANMLITSRGDQPRIYARRPVRSRHRAFAALEAGR